MSDLAISIPLHEDPIAGQSEQAMLQTEDMDPDGGLANADSLTAQDAEPDDLDESLMRRDLKSRIFGSSTMVRIGRYEILRRIGRGGMGTVYVAHDPELDRRVALKVLRPDRRSGQERMLHEARALARLSHPNVVTVHEVGLHDERVFVAMELVEGETLRARLQRVPERIELFGVFLQAARGLQAAHRAGLVHRDFKPENVLIGNDDRVRVVDFGVVKATDSVDLPSGGDEEERRPSLDSLPDLTLTGQLLGTPAYMAAEQFTGESVDARTDVFAFCVALYEALEGRRPFAGDDVNQVCRAVLAEEVEPLSARDVPPQLAALVRQGLSRDPSQRPASMDGLVEVLQSAATPGLALRRRRRRRWAPLALGGVGMLAVGIGIAADDGTSDTEDARVVVAAGSEHDESDHGKDGDAELDRAFEAIVLESDDSRRRRAAEIFLEHYGDRAAPSRRAIAHSVVGDVLWRTSCPEAWMGLCVEEQPATTGDACRPPRNPALVPRPRDPELKKAALVHLDEALSLAGVGSSVEPDERASFGVAIGRARVQRLDADLEDYFGIEVPHDLDFADDPKAEALSRQAFAHYQQRVTREGEELMTGYAKVKQSGSPQWVIVAAARTGMLLEHSAEALTSIPIPPTFNDEQRGEYCKALGTMTQPLDDRARAAYAYCVERSDEHDVVLPGVELCRQRLAKLPAPEAEPE